MIRDFACGLPGESLYGSTFETSLTPVMLQEACRDSRSCSMLLTIMIRPTELVYERARSIDYARQLPVTQTACAAVQLGHQILHRYTHYPC